MSRNQKAPLLAFVLVAMVCGLVLVDSVRGDASGGPDMAAPPPPSYSSPASSPEPSLDDEPADASAGTTSVPSDLPSPLGQTLFDEAPETVGEDGLAATQHGSAAPAGPGDSAGAAAGSPAGSGDDSGQDSGLNPDLPQVGLPPAPEHPGRSGDSGRPDSPGRSEDASGPAPGAGADNTHRAKNPGKGAKNRGPRGGGHGFDPAAPEQQLPDPDPTTDAEEPDGSPAAPTDPPSPSASPSAEPTAPAGPGAEPGPPADPGPATVPGPPEGAPVGPERGMNEQVVRTRTAADHKTDKKRGKAHRKAHRAGRHGKKQR